MEFTGLVQNLANGLLIGGVYALVGVGLSLIFGVMRVINFAHGDFVVLGMYSALVVYNQLGWDPYLSFSHRAAARLFAGRLAVERLVLSRLVDAPADSTLLATLGLALVVQNTLLLIFGASPRSLYVPYATATVRLGPITLSLIQIDCQRRYSWS